MIRQLMAQSPLLVFPIVGLLIFVGVFVVVVARIARLKADEFDAAARIPLGDDDEAPRAAASPALEGVANATTRPALEKGR